MGCPTKGASTSGAGFLSGSLILALLACNGFNLPTPHVRGWLLPTRHGNPHASPRTPCPKGSIGCTCFGVSEWERAWESVSNVSLDQQDEHGFTNRDRLPRYLTSLGWPKDGEHILQLTANDVHAIESGATHHVMRTGLMLRMREFKREWEVWQDGGNPTGHAVFQRLSHWRAGWHAFRKSPLLGHGIGDTPTAMERAYDQHNFGLRTGHRHRTHMQHLTWGISTGCPGLVLWLGFG